MKTWEAYVVVGAMVGAGWLGLTAAWPVAFGLLMAGLIVSRSRRRGLVAFTLSTLTINALLVALFAPGSPSVTWLGITLGVEGAGTGLVAGLRLSAILVANLAILSWAALPELLDALRLPVIITGRLGALMLAGHALGQDLERLVAARQLSGTPAAKGLGRLREATELLPALLVAAVRRAEARRDALQLAGIMTGARFAPIVAVAALAMAGRLAFLALPNVALTYVLVFLGGLIFGSRVGVLAAIVSMALTDLMLSGFVVLSFSNIPAMALVGAAGGWVRRIRLAGRGDGRLAAALFGVLLTLAFSSVSDAFTWLLVPEYRAVPSIAWDLIRAGWAFNAIPALANGFLFALSVEPVSRAFAAYRAHQSQAKGAARHATTS